VPARPARTAAVIDLRSDTATRPTAGMRAAIAAAEVGDEQRGEDPTVRALEERVAELLGHDDAVFLPTATMANQIALRVQTRPGDEIVATADCHIYRYELGGAAVHSGLAMQAIPSEDGAFGPADLAARVTPPGSRYAPPTRIVAVENTHNAAGGRVWPVERMRAVAQAARDRGLRVHLDGARLMNAAVAHSRSPADWGRLADSVTLCLSKGLGCPLGATLAGPRDLVGEARRLKHAFGGAMRQAGIVAAAGVYALDHHVERLAEDHAHARRLADRLASAGVPLGPGPVETNFVLVDVGAAGLEVEEAVVRARQAGVLVGPATRPGQLRLVTHLDVGSTDVDRAADALATALT
jgi:threonine aldolase